MFRFVFRYIRSHPFYAIFTALSIVYVCMAANECFTGEAPKSVASNIVTMLFPAIFTLGQIHDAYIAYREEKASRMSRDHFGRILDMRIQTLITCPKGKRIEALLGQYVVGMIDFLYEYVGKYQYQVSIFSGGAHPRIVAYCDTLGNVVASSAKDRKIDEDYYRKKGYAVVALLDGALRADKCYIVPDTAKAGYSFVSDVKRAQSQSHLMFLIDGGLQFAITVSCNGMNGLNDKQEELKALVMRVSRLIRSDLRMADVDGCLPIY